MKNLSDLKLLAFGLGAFAILYHQHGKIAEQDAIIDNLARERITLQQDLRVCTAERDTAKSVNNDRNLSR